MHLLCYARLNVSTKKVSNRVIFGDTDYEDKIDNYLVLQNIFLCYIFNRGLYLEITSEREESMCPIYCYFLKHLHL